MLCVRVCLCVCVCVRVCVSQGGRKAHDLGAIELAKAVEELGAGEILLNCIDNDGVGQVS